MASMQLLLLLLRVAAVEGRREWCNDMSVRRG
jgi:hypothetical protein